MAGKKKVLIVIIILLAVLLLIAAGVAIKIFLFPDSVSGDWELIVNPEVSKASSDEQTDSDRVFYTFGEAGKYGDGIYKTYYGSGIEEGQYKLSEKDGKNYIYLGTENLEYSITGSRLFGNAKLTITFPEKTDEQTGEKTPAQDYIFAQAQAPDYESESYENFETDSRLLSEWVTKERSLSYFSEELSYTETVRFNKNGIMTIHYESADLALDRYMYYAYTAADETLTFSPVTDKDSHNTVSYEFDEKGNLRFTQDSTSSSIFADEIFSDVTYYSPDKLPEPEESVDTEK